MLDLNCCKLKCVGCKAWYIYYPNLCRKSVSTSGIITLYTLQVRKWNPERENDLPKGTWTWESEAGWNPSPFFVPYCVLAYLLELRWRTVFHVWGPWIKVKAPGKGSQRRLEPIQESGVGLRVPTATLLPYHFVSRYSRNIFSGPQVNAISSVSKRTDTKTSFKKYCWIICRVHFKNIGRHITPWSAKDKPHDNISPRTQWQEKCCSSRWTRIGF